MFEFSAGSPLPLGATVEPAGVNFAIFSRNASSVTLVVYENDTDEKPLLKYPLDPKKDQTGDIWHCFIKGLKEGYWYGYFIDGEYEPKAGKRFNPNKLLIDPYARCVAIDHPIHQRNEMFGYDKNSDLTDLSFSRVNSEKFAPRAQITRSSPNNSTNYKRKKIRDHVIYEMHVKGFTAHPNSGVKHRGTFGGIVEKIPYLKDLGVTAIELLPIHAFDDKSVIRHTPDNKPLRNYWGYDPISFSSLHPSYGTIDEFKDMVNKLHDADIDIIMDVVFNHTGEGNELGPTISFRGIDNQIYYLLDNGRGYKNFTGCGNTVNCNHPVVRDMIMDSLLYWVVEMGVDGFRFDLASVFSRDSEGAFRNYSPLIEKIAEHPILRDIIIIAEAWDAAGTYQVGSFGGVRWAEWNGVFRDDIRSFLKADKGSLAAIAERITGSPAMFLQSSKFPSNSINFITCHDGFTLHDLFSYNEKHNLENGENNADGYNDNRSWNCGVEGETNDAKVVSLRDKQMKNAFALLMISLGVPMINAGDEFARTQKGNNNAYCQDNEISWLDWSLLEKNRDLLRFVKNLITMRNNYTSLKRRHFYSVPDGKEFEKFRDFEWFGERGQGPDWGPDSFSVSFMIKGWTPLDSTKGEESPDIFIMINSHWEPHTYLLPKAKDKKWFFVCDTDKKSPNDIVDPAKAYVLDNQNNYTIEPRSVVILIGKKK